MQRSPLLTSLTAIVGSLLLASAAPAAELGDIAVRSYIGQPLSADIELVQIAPDEAASLQVRLAQENVYRGANISMNPALAGLHMALVRREGRQYLRVSTTRPIEAEYLHLFLELSGAGRQEVRAATVWLQADPNPGGRAGAAPMAAVGSPAPAPLPPAPVSTTEASHAEPAAAGRSRVAPMPSLHESEVGGAGGLRASAPAPVLTPTRRAAPASKPAANRSASPTEPAAPDGAVPAHVAQALLPMPNLPLPKGVKRAPAPAACSASPAVAAKECAAFDAHSQELNSKLTELEGKLKVLQGALGGPVAAKGAAAPAANGKPESASAMASASATASAAAKLSTSAGAAASAAASVAAHGAESTAASAAGEAASGERWVPPPGVQGELAKARAAAAARGEASEAASASASASAEASAAASGAASEVASGPVKKVKVLPKLKYKKEKPPEPAPGSSNLPLIAASASVALLVLGLAGWLFWRKKRGAPPLKIGQLFRKKKAAEPEVKHEEALPLEEVTPESLMQQ